MTTQTMKNARVLVPAVSVLLAMTVLVSYAPTLYRMFCAATGYGGATQRATAQPLAPTAVSAKTVKVLFDANVDKKLDWTFRPDQREVTVHFGEPTKISYYAKNNTDHTIVARAVFNIAPYSAAPYFFKVQCFCFTNERLGPGESAHMPVVFYVDKQYLKDLDTKNNTSVTLSYTFYKQDKLDPKAIAATRDLAEGSKQEKQTIASSKTAAFDNEAPRRGN